MVLGPLTTPVSQFTAQIQPPGIPFGVPGTIDHEIFSALTVTGGVCDYGTAEMVTVNVPDTTSFGIDPDFLADGWNDLPGIGAAAIILSCRENYTSTQNPNLTSVN